jgi:pilus assembly protein CpaC
MNILRKYRSGGRIAWIMTIIFAVVLWHAAFPVHAKVSLETLPTETLSLVAGKSIIVKSPHPVKRVSIANPDIADFVLLSSRQIYLTAKSAGTTNLSLWQDKNVIAVYDLQVSYDLSLLKQKIHEVLPDEQGVKVIATRDAITLSGRISNSANLSQVMAMAEAYAPKGKVYNLMEVGGVHQVMLEVRVAEMSKQLINRLGVNFNYVRGGDFGVTTLGGLTEIVDPDDANIFTDAPFGTYVSSNVNALFRFHSGSATWTGFIDALKSDGLVKILAEPTLITLSGQGANFLAGGEYPVPVPQGLGTVAIEYKPFGVGLSFTPTVLSEKKISIQVTPEVSELDFSIALPVAGYLVPGLSTRKASTTVELADGQSFAIAGLIKETIKDNLQKYPFLGDIPILGTLFRSHSFQKDETELIIIATPHLVKPLDMAKQSLPTDFYIEPNDMEFFLEGLMEGRGKNKLSSLQNGLDGEFGHVMP